MPNSASASLLVASYGALRAWLIEAAFDLWWLRGADHAVGGFHERLNVDATPTAEPRRARLHPRQAFAYSLAAKLGWRGPSEQAVAHAMAFFLSHYRRADGFFRATVAASGSSVDDGCVLYDQAFALLGFAAAHRVLGGDGYRQLAMELQSGVRSRLANSSGGFRESVRGARPLSSNSHMHLLEASLAWIQIDDTGPWRALAAELVELALSRCIDDRSGALPELFDYSWQPYPAEAGQVVEPGHQFEWAWLLLRAHRYFADARITPAALRLIEVGETYGVDKVRDVAVNQLRHDLRVLDTNARLWPQTERLRAACAVAEASGDGSFLEVVANAANSLTAYLDTPVRGLWRDLMDGDGSFRHEPSPASSLYHIVGAIAELDRLCGLLGISDHTAG